MQRRSAQALVQGMLVRERLGLLVQAVRYPLRTLRLRRWGLLVEQVG
jgi:hypothetical protein